MNVLSAGQIAPDFSLFDDHGHQHHLSNQLGQRTLVYFYPRMRPPAVPPRHVASATLT